MTLAIVVSILVGVVTYILLTATPETEFEIPILKPQSVCVMEISGMVVTEKPVFSITKYISPDDVKELLERAKRENCGALVLVINSPGGSATGSYLIYTMIRKFKEENNIPVVVYVTESALSGGYLIALSGDCIVASPTSLVGSIGSVVTVVNYRKLLEKLGIEVIVLKSGKYKDIASPFRELSSEEKTILERIVNTTYKVFVDAVLKERGDKLDKKYLNEILNASIFCGRDAVKVGLVDAIGDLDLAIEKARELGKLPPTAPIKYIELGKRPALPLPLNLSLDKLLSIIAVLDRVLLVPTTYLQVLYVSK